MRLKGLRCSNSSLSLHSLSYFTLLSVQHRTNCPQMSTAVVLHRPQHARRRRDVLEALKLVGLLGLEFAGATAISRWVAKGAKFFIKRQKVRAYLAV